MKRYERMSKEGIMEFFTYVGGHSCEKCILKEWCSNRHVLGESCVDIAFQWLCEECKTKKVHRYELIKADADLDRIREEWYSNCGDTDDCSKCKYYARPHSTTVCFANYLKEEIEVEE